MVACKSAIFAFQFVKPILQTITRLIQYAILEILKDLVDSGVQHRNMYNIENYLKSWQDLWKIPGNYFIFSKVVGF